MILLRLAALLLVPAGLWAAATVVRVDPPSKRLLVNGQAFTVQGVNYSPTPVGASGAGSSGGCSGPYRFWDHPSETYIVDFPLIARIGANTIRTYSTMNDTSVSNVAAVRAMLDKAHEHGLYVIMAYYPSHTDPINAGFESTVQTQFLAAVNEYKDHSAVLMWALGNEQNLDNGFNNAAWYTLVNTVAGLAQTADPDHPVMTVEGEVIPPDGAAREFQVGNAALGTTDALIPNLDIWGINAYRGPSFGTLFDVLAASTTKPILITEFGKDSYRDSLGAEDVSLQAYHLRFQWPEIAANASALHAGKNLIGGAVFEWSDEWWKDGGGFSCNTHNATVLFNRPTDTIDPGYNDEWFGLIRTIPETGTARSFRTGYATLQTLWNPEAASAESATSVFSSVVRNYPNPFRSGDQNTRFVAEVAAAATVDIRIYDAGGQFVASLNASSSSNGRVELIWDGRNRKGDIVSAGLYFARIEGRTATAEETQFRRVVAVK